MNTNVTTYTKTPVIGRVQHGEQITSDAGKLKVIDYGYFIAKIQESNMQPYLDKFNKSVRGTKSIDVQFLDENPLSIKNERANQSGKVCYCLEGQSTGKQKVKNLWQPIECTENCVYLKKDSNGKSQCNRIAWLKFLIPSIATDRIWLMRITGRQSIENLKCYIDLQKMRGNSLKDNTYTIFLTQEEQVNFLGKTFTNYVLDILKKGEFISQDNDKKDLLPTVTTHPNSIQEQSSISNTASSNQVLTTKQEGSNVNKGSKAIDKQVKKSTTKKSKEQSVLKESKAISDKVADSKKNQEVKGEYDDCYVLLSTHTENQIVNGKPKEYFMAEFTDMNDNISNIAIKPDFITELSQCELGTVVKLAIKEIQNMKFALDVKFVEKHIKKVA